MINNRLLFHLFSHFLRDQICFCFCRCFVYNRFKKEKKKVISELRYFCFNAFYNVTVMHFNSILWEEQLRNKGLQRETRRVFSLYSPLCLRHTSPLLRAFWLPIILAQKEIL